MDEVTSNLVKKFNFKPKYIRRKKYMYICNTDRGIKVIRPVNYTTDKIVFAHNIKNHMINKGFTNLDNYYLSCEGLPYVINEDIVYTMTDYIDLDDWEFTDNNKFKIAIELLANFHKLSQGYNNENFYIEPIDIKENFKRKLEQLIKIKKQTNKQKKLTDFEILFIKNFEHFYKNAVETIDILEKYKYENLNMIAKKNNMICHNKIKEENILIGDKCYITQLENITIDHYVYDLASFINRYIKKHTDNYINLEEILTIYSKINYIDKSVLPILYALIKFPSAYIETCQSFSERRRNFTPISIFNDLEEVVYLKDFSEQYLGKIKYN